MWGAYRAPPAIAVDAVSDAARRTGVMHQEAGRTREARVEAWQAGSAFDAAAEAEDEPPV
ncbi:MAG: hypothetical protein OXH09_18710 [Gammaproteobacteria bacterium]|nr:hypothetical protein [Gammaproteobacteria bacterium]